MPALKNVRNDQFCQHIATSPKTGMSQGQCYEAAGYKTNGNSAEACASRLLSDAKVQARIAELGAPTVRKTRATIDSLASQFDAVFDGAMGSAQFGAAGAAAAAKSKLLGFMRDRLEVGGVGAFDQCETVPQLVEALLADQTPTEALETLDALREQIELHALTHAVTVIAAPDRTRINESALSLAVFRKPRKNGRGTY
jgi:hypothetical protein